MSETEASSFDVRQLRRGLRDLAALSALPVVWTESDPRRIAESLADVLLHMLHLELVYILVKDRAYEFPVEVAHTARGPAPTAQAEEIGRALDPWLDSNDLTRIPSSIANPLGNGMTRIICPPFGIEARGGVLVACSPRADFPTEVDRLLLGVAANQVAVLLDRRRTEDALRESEERFRGTFENAGVGIADCDLQGRFLRVNRKLCEIVGYTREELLQKTWQDLTHPDDLAASLEQFVPFMRGEQPGYSRENRYVRKDGSPVWVDMAVSLRRDAAGAPAYVIAILQDISARKQLEEELSRAHARLDLAVRGSNTGIWEIDMPDGVLENGRATCTNIWERLGDAPPESPIDFATLIGLVHPDDREPLERDIQAYLSGETEEFEVEYRAPHKDGSHRWRLARGVAVRDPAGRPIRLIATSVDITDFKRAEEALRASEQRFQTFVDHATDAFFLQDDRGVILDVNRQACESLGYTRDELVGKTPPDFDPDVTPAMLEEFGRRLDAGEIVVFESRHRRKDGSVLPVEVRGRPFWEGGRRLTVSLARDITEHKQAEAALRESERRFRTLTEALPQLVWTCRPDGYCDYLGRQWVEYTGVAEDEQLGDRWAEMLHPDDRDRTMASWRDAVEGRAPFDVEHRIRGADGRYRWFKARGRPLCDDSGRPVKWFGTCTDIDDQKRAAEALRLAKEAAEAASRAKDEFLANVSHEIRTPMNAILGMTELALDTPLTGEQREYLAIVKSSADALLKVINDLLDFAKIEAGKLELDHADFSLRHVLGETLRALALRAHRKGLELACRIQPELPDALIGDAGRLRQVLLNLIGNAIKFTEQGEVVVRVEAGVKSTSTEPDPSVPEPRPSQVLHFAISDTGIGIPREKQATIFQAFEQGDNSTTRRYEGTGLGLSIASRLVALMGGQILVESDPGRGSTFGFTAEFGLQPAPARGPHERPLVDLHGLRVLIVDDNATNRQILEEWLRDWHTEPLAVGDGFKALDALWRAASIGRPFALVLLDARMPGTDGLAVAESLRRNPVLSTSRIILLTSEDLRGDLARYRALGIAAYAMKPVPQEELLEIIYRVLSRPVSADGAVDLMDLTPAEVVSTATAARHLRILVAEDNPFNQLLVEHHLRRKGHDVRVASDGREALAALEQARFDLLLLDVHMPGCDGFQVIEALRERERATGGHLPVIALTARAMRSDRERCLQAGMDDYLAKPIAAAELFRVMDRVLAGRPATEPEPTARGQPATLLDAVTLLAACDNDATLLSGLIQVFQADTPGALARVRAAVQGGEAARLREAAHELRGLLSTFAATAAAAAARLETMGAGGQLDEAASTLDGLAEMVERLGLQLGELSIENLRHQAAGGGPA